MTSAGIGQPPPLARGLVDRAALHRRDQAWLDDAWPSAQVLVLDDRRRAVVEGDDDRLRLVLVRGTAAPAGERHFLGQHDGVAYFAVPAGSPVDEFPVDESPVDGGQDGQRWADLRQAGALLEDRDAGLMVTAVALANWHATHRHCPRCGAPTRTVAAGWVTVCDNDGSEHYPRLDPAMIVLVHDGAGHCLLGHNVGWPAGRFSTLAGFVEPGESAEQAVIREVAEETGVVVRGVQYVASQPWPMPSSLMLGFRALADFDGGRSIDVDGDEIEDARWFTRAELCAPDGPMRPYGVSIAAKLIADWLAES